MQTRYGSLYVTPVVRRRWPNCEGGLPVVALCSTSWIGVDRSSATVSSAYCFEPFVLTEYDNHWRLAVVGLSSDSGSLKQEAKHVATLSMIGCVLLVNSGQETVQLRRIHPSDNSPCPIRRCLHDPLVLIMFSSLSIPYHERQRLSTLFIPVFCQIEGADDVLLEIPAAQRSETNEE